MIARTHDTASRRLGFRWPLIIVGLLVAHVAGMSTAVVIATRDKSFVVLPDYYKNALKWDQNKTAHAASDALGWTRTLSVGEFDANTATRSITLKLADRGDRPLTGLAVTIVARPEMDPNHSQTLGLSATGDGTYSGRLQVTRTGVWNFEITASRDADRYVSSASPWIGR